MSSASPDVAEPASRPLSAVLLAAGFATRLYPLTRTCAKPLLEVGGQPLVTRLVRQLEETRLVRDVIVVVNAKFSADFERWRAELSSSLPVRIVSDGVTEDTANLGAIADLELALAARAGPPPTGWVVAAGDNLCDFDLTPLCERWLATRRGQLLVRRMPPPIPPRRYNEVELEGSARVIAFREKPAVPTTDLAAIAVYALPPELPQLVAEYLAAGGNRDAPGYLMEWLSQRIDLEGHPLRGRWFDIGDAEQLAAARAAFA